MPLQTYATTLAALLTGSAAAAIVAVGYAPVAAPAPVAEPLRTQTFAPHVADEPSTVGDAIAQLESRLTSPTTPRKASKPRTSPTTPRPVKSSAPVKVTKPKPAHVADDAPAVAPAVAGVEKPSAPVVGPDLAVPVKPKGFIPAPGPTTHTPWSTMPCAPTCQ